ncbi:MAG: alpha/beta hydrolase [Gammaproteobacteria bacterium]|nr:alpha/beta hydrolase [Gammaproteobacteria bacterium]
MEMLIRLLVVAGLAYVAFCALLFFLQDRMIFFPRPLDGRPSGPDVEPLAIHAGEALLRGWVVNPDRGGVVSVYFGGNAEEVSHLVAPFAKLDATSVLVNYRGFGESEGTASAAALLQDSTFVVEWVRERFAGRELAIVGRSLGSGIAARAAAEAGVERLVLVSPYRSIAHIASSRFPFVPVRWLLRHNIDVAEVAAKLPVGVLVIHALDDRVVPTAESQALVGLLREPQVVIWNGPHNVQLDSPPIWPAMRAYLER